MCVKIEIKKNERHKKQKKKNVVHFTESNERKKPPVSSEDPLPRSVWKIECPVSDRNRVKSEKIVKCLKQNIAQCLTGIE